MVRLGRLILRLGLTVALLALVRPAGAHGLHDEALTLRLDRVPAGPYVLTVWTASTTGRAGTVHFLVRLDDLAGVPALGREVFVNAVIINGEHPPVTARANPATAETHFRYETEIELVESGQYQVVVKISDGGELIESRPFDMRVESSTFYKWLTIVFLAQALLTTCWFLKEGLITWRKYKPQLLSPT
jgi:hypothetical protein